MDLNKLFDDYFEEQKEQNSDEVIWEEDPVTFKEFIASSEHMNFPPYSQRQLDVFDFMFGDEPKKIFENEHSLAVLAWGKGCLASNVELEDAFTHEKYTVQELYKNNKSIYISCYDEKNKVSTIEKASIPWISGKGSIYRVTTESGKSIDVFEQHQFYTKNGWKQLCDLHIGDDILDDYDNKRIINNIVEEFKNNNNKEYTEQDVKNFILNKFPIKGKIGFERNNNYSIYNKALYKIMGKDWRNKKFGLQKEKHPLWGKHQSEESKRKNSESNKISLKKFYKSDKGDKLRKHFSKIFSGKNNPMFGKNAPVGSGKCKYYKFKNLSNEEFYLQGSWELKFAKFLNDKKIIWQKNFDRFNYTKNGVEHTYCPDFKLFFENEEIYVEIKGLEDENVELKLQAVKNSGKNIYIIRQDVFRKYYLKYNTPILKYDKIKSIKYLKEDDYYDLEVDKYHNYLAHGLYNHNSGKDTVSCHATLYVVYVLLCCKNPTKLFKGVTADYLDILNVAYNHRQSVDVFMAKLILAVKNWKWLKKKYKYVDSGKSIKDDKKYESTDVVNIKQDRIIFPKYIRAMAKCSQQDAAEGTNLLVWIADEFSAFSDKNSKSNAIEMFETLKTSSTTRFQNYGKGFVISFTRYKNDPILKLIDQYKDDINTYCDIASTFAVKPRSAFKGEWGEWNGIEMPKSFIPDFEKNPEGSKAKYLCQPPDAEDPWITETVFIDESFNERIPMFEFSETTKTSLNGNMIIKDIVRKNFNIPDKMFVIAGDIGLTTDRTVITMWHDESMYLADGSVIKKYVQDFTLSWVPNKAQNRKVDVNNVEYVIKKLLFEYKMPVSGIYFDHFSSIQLLDELANKGIVSQQHTLKVDDFAKFKILLYSRSLDFIKESVQEEELRRLVNGKDGKPDHPNTEHDDTFRANCMAISALEGFGGSDTVVTDDGIFLKGKKSMNTHLDGSNIKGDTVKAELHSSGAFKDDDIFTALNSVNGLK